MGVTIIIVDFFSKKTGLSRKLTKIFFIKIILLVCIFIFSLTSKVLTAKDELKIVIDNNYPPYSFINEKGELTGFSIDLWKKFESKTGIRVKIYAKEWNIAQQEMKEGKYDIIDTLFKNPEREKIYSFSSPYEKVDTHIFYHKNITGISNVHDLKSFQIATKKGGATVNVLKSLNFRNINEFPSDEDILIAAKNHDISAFAIGINTGFYLLHRYGLQKEFKILPEPIFTNHLHRASLKSNESVLALVENGMKKITKAEMEELREKWFGIYQLKKFNYVPFIYVIILLSIGLFLLFVINYFLKQAVLKRTNELEIEKIKFISIFDNANHIIVLLDKTGHTLEANKLTIETMNAEKNKLKGLHLTNYPLFSASEELVKKIDSKLEEVLQEKQKITTNINIKMEGSTERIYYFSFTPILLNNDIKYIIVEGKDLTDTINLTKEIEQLKAEKNMEILVSGLAHDFNNLLSGMNNYLLVIKELNNDPVISETIDKTFTVFKRATNLVKQLQSFTKGLELKYQSVDLSNLIKHTLSTHTFGKNIEVLLTDYLTEKVECDPDLIVEMFENIIINAIQAIKDKGIIKVEMHKIIIENRAFAIIEVSDNGCGIPKDKLDIIFQPLYTTKPKGSGLGLYMVKLIVEKHAGKILVESEENKGTTFKILLPIKKV
ncbi:MAG: transporter substrate-binding domain-containing protein [Calditerrivibrio sp.]|nr:transporter substrate-binding domain-containing protein [Calditerrivibrio sp.]